MARFVLMGIFFLDGIIGVIGHIIIIERLDVAAIRIEIEIIVRNAVLSIQNNVIEQGIGIYDIVERMYLRIGIVRGWI